MRNPSSGKSVWSGHKEAKPALNSNEKFAMEHAEQWNGCCACRESHHESNFCGSCGACFFLGKIHNDSFITTVVCQCGEQYIWD